MLCTASRLQIIPLQDSGITVARELSTRRYYLRALWLTVAPAYEEFVQRLGVASENALTAGQWYVHDQMRKCLRMLSLHLFDALIRNIHQMQAPCNVIC